MRVKEAMTLRLIGVPETATLSGALDALRRERARWTRPSTDGGDVPPGLR